MNENYKVVFEDVNGYKTGDVVPGNMLAENEHGLAYLVKVGAVEQTAEAEFVRAASTSVQGQIDAATASLRQELLDQKDLVAEREATINTQAEQIAELNKEIEILKARAI